MRVNISPIDPAATTRNYRNNYVNMRAMMLGTETPAGVTLKTPQEQPILHLDLPSALRDAMAAYQKDHPEAALLTAVKYMRTVNGNPELVVEDDAPLPAESDLVTFSHTVTTMSIKSVNIVTHHLVATMAAVKG
jgi:hypothetical protein